MKTKKGNRLHMKRICPEILIISNTQDYSTDHVCYNLNQEGVPYLRLDRDLLSLINICLIPEEQRILGECESFSFEVTSELLKSVYYRAPVYLRDNYQPHLDPDIQLSRNQWTSFIKSLIMFEDITWVNNPHATYKAEIKPYQLYLAKQIGFDIPKTIVTNSHKYVDKIFNGRKEIVAKTLDSAILRINNKQAFIYTNIVPHQEVMNNDISTAPIILQEPLIPKTDVRVTVVGKHIYAVDITENGKGIDLDWRLKRKNIRFKKIFLPAEIEWKCFELVNAMNLSFGAIDLVIYRDKYYFLEINPTGEWGWLLSCADLSIDNVITEILIHGKTHHVK